MIMVAGINMITVTRFNFGIHPTYRNFKSPWICSQSIAKIFLYNAAYLILIGLFWGNFIVLGSFGFKTISVLPWILLPIT